MMRSRIQKIYEDAWAVLWKELDAEKATRSEFIRLEKTRSAAAISAMRVQENFTLGQELLDDADKALDSAQALKEGVRILIAYVVGIAQYERIPTVKEMEECANRQARAKYRFSDSNVRYHIKTKYGLPLNKRGRLKKNRK